MIVQEPGPIALAIGPVIVVAVGIVEAIMVLIFLAEEVGRLDRQSDPADSRPPSRPD